MYDEIESQHHYITCIVIQTSLKLIYLIYSSNVLDKLEQLHTEVSFSSLLEGEVSKSLPSRVIIGIGNYCR